MYSIMTNLDTPKSLESLLNSSLLWRGGEHQLAARSTQNKHLPGLYSGYPALDACLPWGGWPASALVEIITPLWGAGELQLVLPLLRNLSQQGKWILWVSPPCLPYAPALTQAGIATGQIIVVSPDRATPVQALWSMEKALQNEACALVLAWPDKLSGKHIRRLQLAASTGKTLGILFHHRYVRHSSAVLQLRVDSDAEGLQVTVLKARGSYRRDSVRLARSTP